MVVVGLMLDGRCLMSVEEDGGERESESICLLRNCHLPPSRLVFAAGARDGLPAPRRDDDDPSIVPGHRPRPVRVFRGPKGTTSIMQAGGVCLGLMQCMRIRLSKTAPTLSLPLSFFFFRRLLLATASRALHAQHPAGEER